MTKPTPPMKKMAAKRYPSATTCSSWMGTRRRARGLGEWDGWRVMRRHAVRHAISDYNMGGRGEQRGGLTRTTTEDTEGHGGQRRRREERSEPQREAEGGRGRQR